MIKATATLLILMKLKN